MEQQHLQPQVSGMVNGSSPQREKDKMEMAGLMGWYALSYIGLAIITGIVLSLLGIKTNSGVSAVLVLAATRIASLRFGKKNKRCFSKKERVKATALLSMVNLSIQAIVLFGVAALLPNFNYSLAFAIMGGFIFLEALFITGQSAAPERAW